jgi:hypothetical protein
MNRREALTATLALFGGTVIGSQTFLSGCSTEKKEVVPFSMDDLQLLDEIAETILPTTQSSPGAKAAKIGEFMRDIVMDCYDEKERKVFLSGIDTFRKKVKDNFNSEFVSLKGEDKITLLTDLDKESKAYEKKDGSPPHYFEMMKQLTIWGYFSSEPGATKAMRYVPIPGKYEGCVDYKKGEGAWVY